MTPAGAAPPTRSRAGTIVPPTKSRPVVPTRTMTDVTTTAATTAAMIRSFAPMPVPVLTGRRCVDGRRAGARDLFVRFIVSYLLKRQTVFARSCKARGHYYVLYTKGAGISTLFMAAPRFFRFCSRFSYPRARCERPRTSLSPSASKPAVIRAAAPRRSSARSIAP